MATTKRAVVNVAGCPYLFLILARVLDNGVFGTWETDHLSLGPWGSWLWVAIKFAYWCGPILIYLSLQGRLTTYLGGKFAPRVHWSWQTPHC